MTLATAPLPRGATLGVLGGGQLGRMFVHAAQQLGFATVVLDPDPASPAGAVAHRHIQAPYQDAAALAELASCAQAVTTEFENVPAQALAELAARVRVAPSATAVAVCQDRLLEKQQFAAAQVATGPHARIASQADIAAVSDTLLPAILKTARLGYDGKGQARVDTRAQLAAAWAKMGEPVCILEQRLALWREVSVILARAADGTVVHLPLRCNHHVGGILAITESPAADLAPELVSQAQRSAERLAQTLGYVGVLCVEFFVLRDAGGQWQLVANEMAPRPHNSGHDSIDACDLSQFDLQVRALAGWPLVTPRPHSASVMLNLLGDLWLTADEHIREPDWAAVLGLPGVHLHLYGKAEARRGRKMGHLTITAPTTTQARAVAGSVIERLGCPPAPWQAQV